MFIRSALTRSSPLTSALRSRWITSLDKQPPALSDAIKDCREQVWNASVAERSPAPYLYKSYQNLRDELEALPPKSKKDFIAIAKDSLLADFKDTLRLLSLDGNDAIAQLQPIVQVLYAIQSTGQPVRKIIQLRVVDGMPKTDIAHD